MERNEVERHAPQGRARTMSDEQEAICRAGTNPIWVRDLIAELDAERAAHEETKAELARVRAHHAADECGDCGTEACAGREPLHFHHDGCPYEYGLEQDNAALKARLALAEGLEAAAANFLSPSRMGCTLEELRAGVVELAHTQPDARAAADTLALIDALAAWRAAK